MATALTFSIRPNPRHALLGLLALTLGCGAGPSAPALTQQAAPAPSTVAKAAPLDLVDQAFSEDPGIHSSARRALRQQGPRGLSRVLERLDRPATEIQRQAVAQIAGQLDAHVSKLFWHTDLDEARERARRERKPILSLRMLGRLDEELSCANSRLFRTVLYPDPRVAQKLSREYVLHWSSERQVPKITIDYGDGRKLIRTITGNSIHYVLDAEGRVVDALPGLMAAPIFVQELGESYDLAQRLSAASDEEFVQASQRFHQQKLVRLRGEWASSLGQFGQLPTPPNAPPAPAPSAQKAVPIAISKARIEAPVIQRVLPPPSFGSLNRATSPALWSKLAQRRLGVSRLSAEALALVRAKGPVQRGPDGRTRPIDEAGLQRLTQRIERTLAEDTIQNEFLLRGRLHSWLAESTVNFRALNQRVYAELFLTPRNDPWLGLLPANTFTALPGDGVVDPGAPSGRSAVRAQALPTAAK